MFVDLNLRHLFVSDFFTLFVILAYKIRFCFQTCFRFKCHDALGDAQLIARFFYAEIKEAKSMNVLVYSAVLRFAPQPFLPFQEEVHQ